VCVNERPARVVVIDAFDDELDPFEWFLPVFVVFVVFEYLFAYDVDGVPPL